MFRFDLLFLPFFIFIFVAVIAFIIFAWFTRSIKLFRTSMPAEPGNQPAEIEKEIIREIVKIRCPYCNNRYDEKLDKCPRCGANIHNGLKVSLIQVLLWNLSCRRRPSRSPLSPWRTVLHYNSPVLVSRI